MKRFKIIDKSHLLYGIVVELRQYVGVETVYDIEIDGITYSLHINQLEECTI